MSGSQSVSCFRVFVDCPPRPFTTSLASPSSNTDESASGVSGLRAEALSEVETVPLTAEPLASADVHVHSDETHTDIMG
jgi:hypothetical protein